MKVQLFHRLRERPRSVRYVDHVASGTKLFRAICERDMEGIAVKQAAGLYTPEPG
jgi:hypothetical protein